MLELILMQFVKAGVGKLGELAFGALTPEGRAHLKRLVAEMLAHFQSDEKWRQVEFPKGAEGHVLLSQTTEPIPESAP